MGSTRQSFLFSPIKEGTLGGFAMSDTLMSIPSGETPRTASIKPEPLYTPLGFSSSGKSTGTSSSTVAASVPGSRRYATKSQTSPLRDDSVIYASTGDEPNEFFERGEPQAQAKGGTSNSFESSHSVMTDRSELSSLPPSFSSKATTPSETDCPKSRVKDEESSATPGTYSHVRPKSSIPTNLSSSQYASECIAAAESSRLSPYALHPDEYLLLRHHISHAQVTTYLNVRNGILRLWMRQPWIGVTRQEAVGCANARWFDAASVCYDWLVRQGYINFGCLDLSKCQGDRKTQQPDGFKTRKTIAVIGAGISGLSCARQLEGLFQQYADRFKDQEMDPPQVVLIEGRHRVGGRVYSREFKTTRVNTPAGFAGKRRTAEMGGMIITGFERGNPMNILVRGQLSLPYHALTAETTIYDIDGRPVDSDRDQLIEKLYNDCLDRVSEFKFKQQPSKLIDGNRDLIDEGRDSHGDGSKSIMQVEEATAAVPHAPPVSQQNVPSKVDMIPISSDKLTGRVHTEPGVPGTVNVSDKVTQMGWMLKADAPQTNNLDLETVVLQNGSTLGSVLDHAITQYKDQVDLSAQDYRLINWHIANLEYSNATNLHNLSLGLWDIDAGNEWEGQHTMVVGGYQSVARGLLHCPVSLDIRTGSAVKAIHYNTNNSQSGKARVECEDGSSLDVDTVVCTIPLGVLKEGSIAFEPPLPDWKMNAIQRLGFGILNKIVLVYDRIFWESDRHIFGVLRSAQDLQSTSQHDYGTNRGRCFQWFNVTNTAGLPCLIALMAGDAGFATEKASNDELIMEATEILKSVFGSNVPHPVEAVVTRWGADRFARGSYSSAGPEMQPEDYDIMSRPVGNLFFAGEHTIGTHPATVHGAYLSGLRAAAEVLDEYLGPIEVPTPLILRRDSLLLQKRKEAAKDSRQARQDAFDAEVWAFVRSKIGDRPSRPAKASGNAYLLYSKAKFEEARSICDGLRKAGSAKTVPNEVRIMTSKMWKEASPGERKPYEDQAIAQKRAYADALRNFVEATEEWDLKAIALRVAYEQEHAHKLNLNSSVGSSSTRVSPKHRRGRTINYAEEGSVDMEF